MARRILGLDIGSHSVKAVELRQTLREFEVVQLRALPIVDPAPSLAGELRDFLQMHDLPVDHVVVGLSGDRLSTRHLSFPFKDRRKVAQAVPFEVESQVPFDLEEFFVDWEAVGGDVGSTEVVATLAPRSEVALLLDTLREAGIDPRVVEPEGLVLANLAPLFELEGTRLLVDLGHRKSTLCLIQDGRAVASRTVPVAGRAITEALAKERGVSELEGERLKVEEGIFGGGGSPPSPLAMGVVDRLAREMVRTLGSLEALTGDEASAELQEITLLGGSAHLHRLDEYLSERIGVRVRRLGLPPADTGASMVAAGDPLLFAPALALGMRGSLRARTHMNLRQDDLAHRVDFGKVTRQFRSTLLLAGVVVLLAASSSIADIFLQNRRAEALERQALALYTEAFPGGSPPSNVVAGMRKALSSAQDRADTLGVYGGNLSALDVLTEISARVPPEVEVIFEELSVEGQLVQLRGHSDSFENVDRLRKELAKFPHFEQITVGDITRDSRRGGQNFNLQISLGGGGGQS